MLDATGWLSSYHEMLLLPDRGAASAQNPQLPPRFARELAEPVLL